MELKTPLRIVEAQHDNYFWIEDADGNEVADDGSACGEYSEKMTKDVARRIVACVNACAGIPNEQLECDNVEFARIFNERNSLKQQRDTLLSLLKENRKHGIAYTTAIESTGDSFDFEDWAKRVDAAIASVEKAP